MRYITLFFVFLLLASQGLTPSAQAETRYVVDELIITLRAGKSTDHKIIKTLKTGTPLEVLEDDDKTYVKVRTADGIEGYVLRQYVSSDPPKTQRIEELERLNSSLRRKNASLEETKNNLAIQLKTIQEEYTQKFSEIRSSSGDLEQKLEEASKNESAIAEKYETLLAQAENVVEIAAERDQLLLKNKRLEADVTALLEKNDSLSDSRMIKWFLAGGSVFLLGWIIGKISRKRRSRL